MRRDINPSKITTTDIPYTIFVNGHLTSIPLGTHFYHLCDLCVPFKTKYNLHKSAQNLQLWRNVSANC